MGNQNFDVIIVGRGPVGLFLACELRLQGLSVLLVERRTQTGLDKMGETRACVIHGRTLEIFENRGLIEKFEACGSRVDWWHYGVLESRLQYSAFSNESKHNCTLFVPQYKTEDILLQRAQELGADIRLGVLVQSIEQSATSIIIRGTSSSRETGPEGVPFTATGKYLVGTDGWRSSVRTMAGFGWDHYPATHTMLSAEVKLRKEMPNPSIVKNAKGILISLKLKVPSGRYRMAVWTPSTSDTPTEMPLTLEEFSQAVEEVTGVDYEMYDPCVLSRFSNESGNVTNYRKQRIFLGGDAGHRHLPAGGQGMNLGIQEVTNLGWKLGAVIRGDMPESLLDTYELERLPIARSVVDNTTAQSLLFFSSTHPENSLREAMNRLLKVPEANRSLARQINGFSYSYPLPLSVIHPDGWATLPDEITGKRAPDVKLRLKIGHEKWLSEFLGHAKWVQLRFLPRVTGAPAPPAFQGQTEVVDVEEILGGDRSMYEHTAELLIRPDGHMGFGRS
ncbi:putative monooxygenase [Neofusicoccum parvum]|uniref:Monooxygenase n=1 Tax=Neofusicoccum parvum TaxID=310453 RepID=A0ACB5SCN1_9PEZI|nr:putative monooxygenase [Neofusicoccum parvum]